jgi:hypothetical protein
MATRATLIETNSKKVEAFFSGGGDSLRLAEEVFAAEGDGARMVILADDGLWIYRHEGDDLIQRRGRVVEIEDDDL